jgi:hypothetical protein
MRFRTTLPGELTAVHDARRFVHDTLKGRDAHADLDDAQLIVSELVTDAVRSDGIQLTISITLNSAGVWLDVDEVDDRSRAAHIAAAQHTFETGCGLTIVDGLAESWGVIPTDTGKHVWVRLADPRCTDEKRMARELVTACIHRICCGDDSHRGATSDDLAALNHEHLRQVAAELAHLASYLTCLCAADEDQGAEVFWAAQLSRMEHADQITPAMRTQQRPAVIAQTIPTQLTAPKRPATADLVHTNRALDTTERSGNELAGVSG